MPCNDQGSVREADPLSSELNNSNKSIRQASAGLHGQLSTVTPDLSLRHIKVPRIRLRPVYAFGERREH